MSAFGARKLTGAECAGRANTAAGLAQRCHEGGQKAQRDYYIRESVNWFTLAWAEGWGL
jgi:hypothetical protein